MTKALNTEQRSQRAAFLGRLHAEYNGIYGAVYIDHFDVAIGNAANPLAQAQHYTGFVEAYTNADIEAALTARDQLHAAGRGARIMRAVAQQGVRWQLAKIWRNVPKSLELELKEKHKNARLLCPICRGEIAAGAPPVVVDAEADLIAEEREAARGLPPWDWPEMSNTTADYLERKIMAQWRYTRASMFIRPSQLDDEDLLF